jgi:anaerobic dimethyl sulfoxide reductase subunit A
MKPNPPKPAPLLGGIAPDEVRVVPVLCNANCGGRCHLKAHVKNGVVVRVTTDESPDDPQRPQLRACLRGRAMRNRLYDPNRLKYPMRRVGPRGAGKFERIAWNDAIDVIATKLRQTLERHGPHSVYIQYGTGDQGAVRGRESAQRLMNLLGGFLDYYNNYSSACLMYTAPYITGYRDTNSYSSLPYSKLIILSGFNPAETIFETNSNYHLARAKEAGARIVAIDPRLTETAATFADEWLPIKPTTDTALFLAMAHVLISENLTDEAFLRRYCVGFDDASMPPGTEEQSFRSYVLGVDDGIAKTPEWAAEICGVEASSIRRLGRQYGSLKPAQLLQGLGPQRHARGEQSVRAGIALACMTGNLGILGGGWGGGEGDRRVGVGIASLPTRMNPVKPRIPVFQWTDAVLRGTEMTAEDGVQDGPLESNIKFIFNLASNVLVNQHANVNRTLKILRDVRLLDFIVTSDQFLTPSAKFSDLVLPCDHSFERNDVGVPWSGDNYIIFGNKAVEPPGECRHDYWWISRVAERLGVGEAFTEGKNEEGWLRQLIAEAQQRDPSLPTYEALSRTGSYRRPSEPYVAFADEIRDPVHYPFRTPSGKIELFSQALAALNNPQVPPLPEYLEAPEGPRDRLLDKYPLQCIGPHTKRRTHSMFDESAWMEAAEPHCMWIHPSDARSRGIRTGDRVRVFNDRGALLIAAHVTNRIRPGVVSIPQGAWYTPDRTGVCQRGCINVLTSERPTPLAHGNAQHTLLVEVVRAGKRA